MDRINRIIKHKLYLEYISKIKVYEQDRIFCKHDMVHFLDVCRLAEILWLKDRISRLNEKSQDNSLADKESDFVERELIYASGLLHDVGRWQEYENGIRHEIASAGLAPEILRDCGFTEEEIEKIVFAISNHRNKDMQDEKSLAGFIYQADKKSRPCFSCEAEHKCDWPVLKKNLEIK